MELAKTHNSYDDELCDRNWCFDDVSLTNFFADWSRSFVDLGEDPQGLNIRAPALFVVTKFSIYL